MAAIAKPDEQTLIDDIKSKKDTGELSFARLRTDERVLARITDGIYRQPSSALRELISNAYDADATTVVINTDAPRFQQITIRDDGNGMDVETLARLIHHIGGSSKRRREGAGFNTTAADPTRSPAGRRLIGKIGIGLFSVAQLTRHFQIVTKVAGSDFRLIAEVNLKNYNEDDLSNIETDESDRIDSGEVIIRSVPADDIKSHGTEIVLMDLRPRTIDLLRSREIWESVRQSASDEYGIMLKSEAPAFHIGILDAEDHEYELPPQLPWDRDTPTKDRFERLFEGILGEIETRSSNPKLEDSFDNYFRIIWNLSLAAPIDYLEQHPFELDSEAIPNIYELKPFQPGQAKKLDLKFGERIRHRLKFKCPERGPSTPKFKVIIDNIELKRPIRFGDFPPSRHAIQTPLLFVGHAKPDLSKIPLDDRGGDLEFEAYFLWSPKVVPRENAGLLIRIGDASGTLFDESFAKYQISENTRLRQITAEIYVTKGLDPALNIDRESFNASHPHYQYISTWTHRALRQIANTLKYIGEQISQEAKDQESIARVENIKEIANDASEKASGKSFEPSIIEISTDDPKQLASARSGGKISLNKRKVFSSVKFKPGRKGAREKMIFEHQVLAVAKVLEAYGLLTGLTYEQQEELLRSIAAIFSIEKK